MLIYLINIGSEANKGIDPNLSLVIGADPNFGLLQILMGVEGGNRSRQELIELY